MAKRNGRKGRKMTPALKSDALCLVLAGINVVGTLGAWFPNSTQLVIACGALAAAQKEIIAMGIEVSAGDNGEYP